MLRNKIVPVLQKYKEPENSESHDGIALTSSDFGDGVYSRFYSRAEE